MKLTKITLAVFASSLTISNITLANDDPQTKKQWTAGFGLYALSLDNEIKSNVNFAGLNASNTFSFNDTLSIRGQYYALNHDKPSNTNVNGFEVSVLYGTGLTSEGFKAYIGAGVYSETHVIENINKNYACVQLSGGGGIGFNWNSISLDLSLGIRTTGDYEDVSNETNIKAASTALILGYRY